MSKMIRVLALEPMKDPHPMMIDDDVKAWKEFCQCQFLNANSADYGTYRRVDLISGDTPDPTKPNRIIWEGRELLYGPAFISACDENGDSIDLTDEQIIEYGYLFRRNV